MSSPAPVVPVAVLEEITLTAPFGVRFWDVAAEAPSEDGLQVVAYPGAVPGLRTQAEANRTGVYFFRQLPGLSAAGRGAGDNAFWSANPPAIPYTLEVSDPAGRYLPFRFSARLPVRGLYGLLSSPVFAAMAPGAGWLPVFSAPSRPAPAGLAVVRAELRDGATGLAAAWALATVHAPGVAAAAGLADARGMLAIPLPYPEPRNFALGSPLRAGGVGLHDQSWSVEVSFHYAAGRAGEALPDLEETLRQPPAIAWQQSSPPVAAAGFTLPFGNDLILRSRDAMSGRDLSFLSITSAGSPP